MNQRVLDWSTAGLRRRAFVLDDPGANSSLAGARADRPGLSVAGCHHSWRLRSRIESVKAVIASGVGVGSQALECGRRLDKQMVLIRDYVRQNQGKLCAPFPTGHCTFVIRNRPYGSDGS